MIFRGGPEVRVGESGLQFLKILVGLALEIGLKVVPAWSLMELDNFFQNFWIQFLIGLTPGTKYSLDGAVFLKKVIALHQMKGHLMCFQPKKSLVLWVEQKFLKFEFEENPSELVCISREPD